MTFVAKICSFRRETFPVIAFQHTVIMMMMLRMPRQKIHRFRKVYFKTSLAG